MKERMKKIMPKPLIPGVTFIYRVIRNCAVRVHSATVGMLRYRKIYKSRTGHKNIYLVGTPEHGNIGDQAIAQAELEMIKPRELGYDALYDIQFDEYAQQEASLRRYINKEDIILTHGGGNMGIEWFAGEQLIRRVLKCFPANRVVVLPQTIYYDDSVRGKNELEKSIKLYVQHKDLHIFARERPSYEKMVRYYSKNNIYVVPDMVVSMYRPQPCQERRGILICLRNDPEKSLDSVGTGSIIEAAKATGEPLTFTDTMTDYKRISSWERDMRIEQKLEEFRGARLVISDRLHGMVFCAITETPGIIFSNYNHKVRGVFDWISDLEYISYMETTDNIEEEIGRLLSLEERKYNPEKYRPMYEQLINVIRAV